MPMVGKWPSGDSCVHGGSGGEFRGKRAFRILQAHTCLGHVGTILSSNKAHFRRGERFLLLAVRQ